MYGRFDGMVNGEPTVAPDVATGLAVMSAAGFGRDNGIHVPQDVFTKTWTLVMDVIHNAPQTAFKTLVWTLLPIGGGDESKLTDVSRDVTVGAMVARFTELAGQVGGWSVNPDFGYGDFNPSLN